MGKYPEIWTNTQPWIATDMTCRRQRVGLAVHMTEIPAQTYVGIHRRRKMNDHIYVDLTIINHTETIEQN